MCDPGHITTPQKATIVSRETIWGQKRKWGVGRIVSRETIWGQNENGGGGKMCHVKQFGVWGWGGGKMCHVKQFGLAAVGDEERCAVRFGEGKGRVEGEIRGDLCV